MYITFILGIWAPPRPRGSYMGCEVTIVIFYLKIDYRKIRWQTDIRTKKELLNIPCTSRLGSKNWIATTRLT